MDGELAVVWRFVRRDLDARTFERWLYEQPQLEQRLGPQLYMEVVSVDFGNAEALFQVRRKLESYARVHSDMSCECVTLPDTAVVDMAHPGVLLDHFEELRRRGESHWWLGVSRCTVCQTPWLVAQEERQNDVYVLRRLTARELAGILTSGQWPTYFDAYGTLLRLGSAAGHRAVFGDPVGDSSLVATMCDIAEGEPGITVTELATLLNLDPETAALIADQAIVRHGARITLDDEPWR